MRPWSPQVTASGSLRSACRVRGRPEVYRGDGEEATAGRGSVCMKSVGWGMGKTGASGRKGWTVGRNAHISEGLGPSEDRGVSQAPGNPAAPTAPESGPLHHVLLSTAPAVEWWDSPHLTDGALRCRGPMRLTLASQLLSGTASVWSQLCPDSI